MIVEKPFQTLHWPDEAATAAFAQALAQWLMHTPDGADAVIELRGDLGAGKTTLVRHLLRACGVSGRIKSPTYAVVEPHQGLRQSQPWPLWHFDFYRFADPREWEDAGFRDIFAGPGLKLMEWADKADGVRPNADLTIAIGYTGEHSRQAQLLAGTPRGERWLQAGLGEACGAH